MVLVNQWQVIDVIGDQCSAMGCKEPASVDDNGDLVVMIRLREDGVPLLQDNGVNLQFCASHAEHFLRNWAGLLAVSDASNQQIYVLVGLTLEEHRAVLARGLRTVLEQWIGAKDE
ncbi:hypothetical protein GOPIP_044_00890 [Gordonia polyisoprenivorans NBRC 16320 = JCM 10675]|nr:hypothetical protein GOPIP_044_00890 [Gordonia polyisoprenivorans NBRC 16320 = JCM 10675]